MLATGLCSVSTVHLHVCVFVSEYTWANAASQVSTMLPGKVGQTDLVTFADL